MFFDGLKLSVTGVIVGASTSRFYVLVVASLRPLQLLLPTYPHFAPLRSTGTTALAASEKEWTITDDDCPRLTGFLDDHFASGAKNKGGPVTAFFRGVRGFI